MLLPGWGSRGSTGTDHMDVRHTTSLLKLGTRIARFTRYDERQDIIGTCLRLLGNGPKAILPQQALYVYQANGSAYQCPSDAGI